jgi:hypothetical protein
MSYWLAAALALFLTRVASAGDGVVALQTAAPACSDDSGNRYVPCGNGTVTDSDTGLVWLANANCFGSRRTWEEAVDLVGGLSDLEDELVCLPESGPDFCDCGLSDGSSPGEWRLPSASEWQTMLQEAKDMGCEEPALTDDSGNNCWNYVACEFGSSVCSFYNVPWAGCDISSNTGFAFWASSPSVFGDGAYIARLCWGGNALLARSLTAWIWPVRGGQ